MTEEDVYNQIGEDGFARLVRSFYAQVPGDDILGPMYPAADMAGAEVRLRDFLVGRFGGPTRYVEQRGHPRLRARHLPFAIDQAARDRWMQLMTRALDEAALPAESDAVLRAFNRWLEDDWGVNFQGRIFAAPYISLADVDWAIEELEWALANDARIINMRASSVIAPDGRRSLGHPLHDPFWQRLNDSGITVCIHSGDAGYGFMLDYWGQDSEFEAFRYSPLRSRSMCARTSDCGNGSWRLSMKTLRSRTNQIR